MLQVEGTSGTVPISLLTADYRHSAPHHSPSLYTALIHARYAGELMREFGGPAGGPSVVPAFMQGTVSLSGRQATVLLASML
jgi:hypothetical protein